jgi:hypothetical protein
MISPGDLFVLPETAGFPVEWAILARETGDSGRLLTVPADTQPLAGSADVEVPPNEPAGPLSLRCRFALWIDAARLDPARRTGTLGPEAVARALRRRSELETGELTVSPLAYEADVDPEYEDWVRDVLIPAHAALAESASPRESPSGVRPLRRWTSFGNPYALAASILLMVTVGLAGGLLWQRERISDLGAERRRVADELRRERARSAEELRKVEEDIAKRDRRAAARLEEERRKAGEDRLLLESQIAKLRMATDVRNPVVARLEPEAAVRGSPTRFEIGPEVSHLVLVLRVEDPAGTEFQIEVSDRRSGRQVFIQKGLRADVVGDVRLGLPAALLPPGGYRLRLFRKDGRAARPIRERAIDIELSEPKVLH